MSQAATIPTTKDALPLVLQARHVSQIMGASMPTIYSLMKRADFPTVCLGEKRCVVPRDMFFAWLEAQAGGHPNSKAV